ncbi:hypothetical protein GCU60_00415 [Blastococcus saxobsidens]|uniref:Glycosyltransferase RgtA/B/C/D-like domain-containing protein n=1 Tax=Blastococcus saxobsidens TaxID=138336 RepID=A0A6L9VXQ0_9ACTN|nr:hypothetical protein [Blastococcus saxobsidens]NEK84239.1 hypothetical protein [Blastococcus saxobsidens]
MRPPEPTSGSRLTGGPTESSPGRRHRLVYLALALGVLLTRLPFLAGTGLGRDPDAWRLWLAGRIAADTGSYVPSRPPGYPALELVATALQGVPWEVFAALTTGATAVAVVAIAALARDLGVRWWPVVGAGLALTHVVLVTSTAFMDYAWALAALGCALLAARRRRPVAAGALLGLAVACRPSSAVAAVALLVVAALLPWWTLRRVLVAGAAAAAVVLAFFAVPLATYGPDLLSAAPEPFRLERTVQHVGAGVAGVAGAVGLALVAGAAAFRWARGGRPAPDGERRAWRTALAAGIVAQLGAYLLLPVDAAYLIPAVAMVWLLAGMLLRRAELAVLVAAAVAGSLVPGLGVPSAAEVAADRRATLEETTAMVEAVERLPAGSLVVVRGRLPQLLALAGAEVLPSLDPAGTAARVTLDGGQVVTYAYRPSDRENPRVYRLPGVSGAPEHLPVLPV